jgi:hypothetical protein
MTQIALFSSDHPHAVSWKEPILGSGNAQGRSGMRASNGTPKATPFVAITLCIAIGYGHFTGSAALNTDGSRGPISSNSARRMLKKPAAGYMK